MTLFGSPGRLIGAPGREWSGEGPRGRQAAGNSLETEPPPGAESLVKIFTSE